MGGKQETHLENAVRLKGVYTPRRAYSPLRTGSRQYPSRNAHAHSVEYILNTVPSDIGSGKAPHLCRHEHVARYGQVGTLPVVDMN
jgi:hypothetical protein